MGRGWAHARRCGDISDLEKDNSKLVFRTEPVGKVLLQEGVVGRNVVVAVASLGVVVVPTVEVVVGVGVVVVMVVVVVVVVIVVVEVPPQLAS